jgi:riboflavin synthase alpha subunit
MDGEYRLRISFDKKYGALIIPKGSITIDGVSLTVGALGDDWCEVSLVPYTIEHTTFGRLAVGEKVNLEFDMIGKYINRYMETHYAGK